MKPFLTLAAAALAMPVAAQQPAPSPTVAPPDMHWVAPGLAEYTDEVLFGDVWQRSDLSLRDRSLVTVSALVASGNTAQLTGHLIRALDNGVKVSEISGVITHLAFYAGWPNAVSTLGVARQVLEARGVTAAQMRETGVPDTVNRMLISRKGSGPVAPGSPANFTGVVQVSAPVAGTGGSSIAGASVRFSVGARSAWHRHALGQTLVITEGCGWVQSEGGPVEKICAGDVVTTAPNVKHWHGATAASPMTHVALSEGSRVEWLEKVTDAEYARGPR